MWLFTKSAQSTGPENIAPERTLSGLFALEEVNRSSCITLENNAKIRLEPARENGLENPVAVQVVCCEPVSSATAC